MHRRGIQVISWIVFAIALVLLVSHSLSWGNITIDGTTLILLAILLVCPLIEQVRKFKVGEFEAEIAPNEIKKVKMEADRSMGTEETREAITPEIRGIIDNLRDLLDKDHILALAKLRMELERILRRLYEYSIPGARENKQTNLVKIAAILTQAEVLSSQLFMTLREVIFLCNRAVHGEYIRPKDARSVMDIGINVLGLMALKIEEFMVKPVETESISQSEFQEYRDAKYRVTTITPYVKNPIRTVRILDQEGLDMFLEGYDEYAEFLVNIERIDIKDIAGKSGSEVS